MVGMMKQSPPPPYYYMAISYQIREDALGYSLPPDFALNFGMNPDKFPAYRKLFDNYGEKICIGRNLYLKRKR
jgi:hypothetical protein